jgi:hypothetical protein
LIHAAPAINTVLVSCNSNIYLLDMVEGLVPKNNVPGLQKLRGRVGYVLFFNLKINYCIHLSQTRVVDPDSVSIRSRLPVGFGSGSRNRIKGQKRKKSEKHTFQ